MLRHRRTAFALVLVAMAAAQPSLAAAPRATPQTAIQYADLDLTNPAGAQIMLTRIRQAAVSVCRAGERGLSTDINTVERLDACHRQAIVGAVRALNVSLVTAAAGRQGFVVEPALLAQNGVRADGQ